MPQEIDTYLELTYGRLDLSQEHFNRVPVDVFYNESREYLLKIPLKVLVQTLRSQQSIYWRDPSLDNPHRYNIYNYVILRLMDRVVTQCYQSKWIDVETFLAALNEFLYKYHEQHGS